MDRTFTVKRGVSVQPTSSTPMRVSSYYIEDWDRRHLVVEGVL